MKWSEPQDIRQAVRRLWDRGDPLRSLAQGESIFPRRIPLRKPTAREISDHFEQVRTWSQQLSAMSHVRLEMKAWRHQVFGQNELPDILWVESLEQAAQLISQQSALDNFKELINFTEKSCSEVKPWLARYPRQALELQDAWPRLIDLTLWIRNHPRPGIYLRQVSLPGIDTKFIETHRSVLSQLFDLVLEQHQIDTTRTGVSGFCSRYGFMDKPPVIQFRFLDPASAPADYFQTRRSSLDVRSFSQLPAENIQTIFLTENETNFLAFPEVDNAIVIFGAGYGFESLRDIHWLHQQKMVYWGDIDTHGFAILHQLRSQFPHTRSMLMDKNTLIENNEFWGEEPKPIHHDLPNLDSVEAELYNELRDNRIRKNLRLEQERIPYSTLIKELKAKNLI